jgi:hypothetical protein
MGVGGARTAGGSMEAGGRGEESRISVISPGMLEGGGGRRGTVAGATFVGGAGTGAVLDFSFFFAFVGVGLVSAAVGAAGTGAAAAVATAEDAS